MKLKFTLAGLALTLATTSASAVSLDDAKAAIKEAGQSGYSWTTTKSLLKKAEKALDKNDASKAEKYLAQIVLHSSMSIKQAETAEKAGPNF